MRTTSPLFLLGALGLLSAAGAASAAVDTSEWKCESCPFPKGTTGAVDVGVAGVSDASAKFGDFTGLQRKGAKLEVGGTVSHRGENGYFADATLGELGNRTLTAQAGREGLYSLRLGYLEVPRHFADDAVTPFAGAGGAVLTLPTGSTLQPADLGLTMRRFDLGGSGIIGDNVTVRVSLRRDMRDGTRGTSGSFYSSAAQLVAPVDHVNDQLEVSAAYTSRQLQARLAYQFSQFRNGNPSLTWDNPFLAAIAGSDRGQLALAPDNQFHQVSGSAGYQLTPKIRASADFAVGRMTQNTDYLASTLNGTLAVPALPAPSLDGRVDTFNGSVKLTAAATDALRVNASYARDVRDNRTAVQSYPLVDTDMFLSPTLRSNTPFGFKQDRYKLSADYRGADTLKLSAGVDQDNRQRSYQEVVNTRETTIWGRLGVQPRENLSLGLKLAHADRAQPTYGISTWFGAPENPLLRKFYLTGRKRDSAGARADLAITEKVSVGLAVDMANDDYADSVIGLKSARSASLAADLSVALSERTQFQLFAQGERIRSRQAGSGISAQPDWNAENKDRFDLLGIGIKHAAIVGKLDIGADISSSRSRSDVTVDAGATEPLFPTAKTSLDSLKVYATYKLQEKMWLTGSLWHEEYGSQDWRWDGVGPATVPNLLAFGLQPPQYRVDVVRVSLRYRF